MPVIARWVRIKACIKRFAAWTSPLGSVSLLTDLFCFDAGGDEIGARSVFGTLGSDLPQGSHWGFILPFTTAWHVLSSTRQLGLFSSCCCLQRGGTVILQNVICLVEKTIFGSFPTSSISAGFSGLLDSMALSELSQNAACSLFLSYQLHCCGGGQCHLLPWIKLQLYGEFFFQQTEHKLSDHYSIVKKFFISFQMSAFFSFVHVKYLSKLSWLNSLICVV